MKHPWKVHYRAHQALLETRIRPCGSEPQPSPCLHFMATCQYPLAKASVENHLHPMGASRQSSILSGG